MNYLGAPVAAFLGFCGFYALLPKDASAGFFAEGDALKWVQLVAAYLIVVTGVVLGAAYRFLATQAETLPPVAQWATDLTRSRDFWIGLVVSPVVYSLLLNTTQGMAFSGMAVMALQNGFTAQVIVEQFVNGRRAETSSPQQGGT
jgi:hypothetical protein